MSTTARHVKYPDSCSDVGTIAESGDIGAFGQLFDGALQGFSVPPCLVRSKMPGRPAQDVPVVGFSGSREANPPARPSFTRRRWQSHDLLPPPQPNL